MAGEETRDIGTSTIDPGASAPLRPLIPFWGTALVIAALCWVFTIHDARAMTGGMPMPGGWTMGMAWMRMPGQTRLGAGVLFTAMWLTMMVAMMLPSSLPMLLLYRRVALFRNEPHAGWLVWLVSSGYFLVWTLFGLTAYLAGAAITGAAMQWTIVSEIVPIGAGVALIASGIYQLTPWKSACLKHCRNPLEILARHLHRGWRGAVGLGVHHGLFCIGCCWALMVMQFTVGVMSLGAMVTIAAVIALEKLVARGPLIAQAIGVAAIAAGVVMLAQLAFVSIV